MDPLRGHDEPVHSVVYSPDGRYIASGSSDFTVRVWDAQTGQSVMALTGHDDAVESVAFSPDGKSIVSGSQDKTIRVWDAQRDWSVMADNNANTEAMVDGRHMVSKYTENTVRWVTCDNLVSTAHTDQTHLDPSVNNTLVTAPYIPLQAEVGNIINKTSIYHTLFHDFYGAPVIFNPMGRWMMGANSCSHLFWVPQLNRTGLFWPRTKSVIGSNSTSIDFNNFVHGKNWTQCIIQA